ncbi:hypothetical protein FRB91_009739 [Serendipita sp. 411]|nr:hypothetical protein FRB91_009739 [Serendipita sp. 411]
MVDAVDAVAVSVSLSLSVSVSLSSSSLSAHTSDFFFSSLDDDDNDGLDAWSVWDRRHNPNEQNRAGGLSNGEWIIGAFGNVSPKEEPSAESSRRQSVMGVVALRVA